MTNDITGLLKKLDLPATGRYENQFYIIDINDSNEYAKMYSKLEQTAVNTEYPSFGTNTNNATVKITNYFEADFENVTYDIFLIADFNKDTYYLKIKERN